MYAGNRGHGEATHGDAMTIDKQFEYLERDIRSRERRGEITRDQMIKNINHLWHVEYEAAREEAEYSRKRLSDRWA